VVKRKKEKMKKVTILADKRGNVNTDPKNNTAKG
jgi:hypothetical protein